MPEKFTLKVSDGGYMRCNVTMKKIANALIKLYILI